jgi:WXXGXW repeat (2 copies)
MRMQSAVCALVLAAGATLAPLTSQARVFVDINVAPPASRVEVVPAARPGYVWAPGYYAWNGRAHVWHGGSWMRERRGYHWVAPAWSPNGARWHYREGYWAR